MRVAVVTNDDNGALGRSPLTFCVAQPGPPARVARLGIRRGRETIDPMVLLGLRFSRDPRASDILLLGYPNYGLETIAGSEEPWGDDATRLHRTYVTGSWRRCNGDFSYLVRRGTCDSLPKTWHATSKTCSSSFSRPTSTHAPSSTAIPTTVRFTGRSWRDSGVAANAPRCTRRSSTRLAPATTCTSRPTSGRIQPRTRWQRPSSASCHISTLPLPLGSLARDGPRSRKGNRPNQRGGARTHRGMSCQPSRRVTPRPGT